MSRLSGLDPFTLPVIPTFEGSYFSDVFMKELEKDHVGVIRTGVKPSVDIQMDLRRKSGQESWLSSLFCSAQSEMVPNLSSKLKVK